MDNFSTDAMLLMIGLCKLMTKHGSKPSLSKSQHAGVTKNGLDNIEELDNAWEKEYGRPKLKILGNKAMRCRTWEIPDESKNVETSMQQSE